MGVGVPDWFFLLTNQMAGKSQNEHSWIASTRTFTLKENTIDRSKKKPKMNLENDSSQRKICIYIRFLISIKCFSHGVFLIV